MSQKVLDHVTGMLGDPKESWFVKEMALQAIGKAPQELLHVGDDPVRDIAPARDLGLLTAWINRNGEAWPEELEAAHHEMTSLEELPL